jgi:chromosome partitioning protein
MVATLMTAPNAGSDLDAKGRSRLAHTIVVGNEKGGAGKSTVAMHLSIGLLRMGMTVGIMDLDVRQRSLARYLENRNR